MVKFVNSSFTHARLSGCHVDNNGDPWRILGIFQGWIMNIKPWRMQVLSFCNSNLWGRKGHGTVSQVIPADRTMSMAGWIGFTGNVIDCTLLSHALLAVRRKLDWAEEVLSGIINLSLNRKSGTYTKLKKLLECNCCRQRTLHKHKNVIYPWHYISCLFVVFFF